MPLDPSDSTIELTAQLPSPSPYLAGSITTLDLSLAAHCWAVSAQVPSMTFGKVERRMLSAAWATCTNSPDSMIRLAVRMSHLSHTIQGKQGGIPRLLIIRTVPSRPTE